jgi:hypothetical protein
MAFDLIQCRRVDCMVVVASDNASGDVLLPWIGGGFRALGAVTTKTNVRLPSIFNYEGLYFSY